MTILFIGAQTPGTDPATANLWRVELVNGEQRERLAVAKLLILALPDVIRVYYMRNGQHVYIVVSNWPRFKAEAQAGLNKQGYSVPCVFEERVTA